MMEPIARPEDDTAHAYDIAGPPAVDAFARIRADWVGVDDDTLPKRRRLYGVLYEGIASGRLPFGAILPPSRRLATDLDIARNTVIAVYRQLDDERLVESAGRRGTRVVYRRPRSAARGRKPPIPVRLSQRATRSCSPSPPYRALAPGEPDADLFPRADWRRALAVAGRLDGDALGYRELRQSRFRQLLARHLATYRSLDVDPERLVITAGTRQSLALFATLFADPGERVWVESPGYTGAVDAFRTLGLRVEAMPVDADGARVPQDDRRIPLAYTTPCFQYPTGATLSSARRERLLARCRDDATCVFEDDYDSEFRDHTEPRPALAIDEERVLHAGTFSKLLFPAARVAWLVVPSSVVPAARRCLRSLGGGHHTVLQEAVANLLEEGAIARHLVRARTVYARRRERLLGLLAAFPAFAVPAVSGGSLSLVVPLHAAVPRRRLERALIDASLGAIPVEAFAWDRPDSHECRALVLGLGNVDLLGLPQAVDRLAHAVAYAAADVRTRDAPVV